MNDDTLKALIEAIIYVAPEPVPLEAILKTLAGEERERVKAKLEELIADFQQAQHGIQIRQVAAGYKFSSKAEHHEVVRGFVKSLKPPMRLSRPGLETLAVIAYRQPVTLPEIDEIRGVDCGGVIHTLMEKKLVVTAGRKNVVGRPILYRTSREFLVHFGLKDTGELPSLKEFEELARQALGGEFVGAEAANAAPPPQAGAEAPPANGARAAQLELPAASEPAPPEATAAGEPVQAEVPPASELAQPEGSAAVEPAESEVPVDAEPAQAAASSGSPAAGEAEEL
jgi:segregation and condensation protein B